MKSKYKKILLPIVLGGLVIDLIEFAEIRYLVAELEQHNIQFIINTIDESNENL